MTLDLTLLVGAITNPILTPQEYECVKHEHVKKNEKEKHILCHAEKYTTLNQHLNLSLIISLIKLIIYIILKMTSCMNNPGK